MIFHNNEEYKTSQQLISKFTNFGNKRYPVEYISPTKNNPFMNISLDDYEKNPNEAFQVEIKTTLMGKQIR